jgi:hypothetical protein
LPDANFVVLASHVLHTFEVESLDDALTAEVELGAARWRLDCRSVMAVDLSDPESWWINQKNDIFPHFKKLLFKTNSFLRIGSGMSIRYL